MMPFESKYHPKSFEKLFNEKKEDAKKYYEKQKDFNEHIEEGNKYEEYFDLQEDFAIY